MFVVVRERAEKDAQIKSARVRFKLGPTRIHSKNRGANDSKPILVVFHDFADRG